MDKMTVADVADYMTDLVERLGRDYRSECKYMDYYTGAPRCPNGVLFQDLGFSYSRIKEFGGMRPKQLAETHRIPEFTPDAVNSLHMITLLHDGGHSLDVCAAAARDLVDNIAEELDFAPEPEMV